METNETHLRAIEEDNLKGVRTLFGENEPFQVCRLFCGTITTYKNDSRYDFKQMIELLKKMGYDDGQPHPHDSEYYQVPAKLLIGKNGDVRIFTKNHLDIQLFGMSELSGKLIVNEVMCNGKDYDARPNPVASQSTT